MDQNSKDNITPALQCGGQDYLSETEDMPETTEDRIIRLLYELEDKSSSLRDDVAYLLRTLAKRRKEINILINALKHEDSIIRKNAAYILGNLRDPLTVEPLIEVLNDEDADVRGEVVRTLGAIRDDRAIEPLIKTLNDECREIRGWAASALTKIGFSAVDPLIAALDEDNNNIRMNATWALGHIENSAEKAVAPITGVLDDDNDEVRFYAAEALGIYMDKRTVLTLLDSLRNDHDESVRWKIIEALGFIKDKRAVNPLTEALANEDAGIRRKIVEVLGFLGDKGAIVELLNSLKYDEDPGVRWRAAESLRHLDEELAIGPLIVALNDEDAGVKRKAVQLLGRIGDQRAIQPLTEMKKEDIDTNLFKRIEEALDSITERESQSNSVSDEIRNSNTS